MHIGLTATPKETNDASNTEYFGEPVYTYSLKQGIDDGFLAPYKVVRVSLNVDAEGYRPEQGKTDKEIALQLKIEVSSVRTYINRIFEKLQVQRRSAIASLMD